MNGQGDGVVEVRLRLNAAAIGFTPPPLPLRLKVLRVRSAWAVYALAPTDATPAPARFDDDARLVETWLPPEGLERVHINARARVIRAEYSRLPEAWHPLFDRFFVRDVRLDPDGGAVITVEGPRSEVRAFVAWAQSASAPTILRRVSNVPARARVLTPHQRIVIEAAVEAGYYDIPRRINLHDLARVLDTSSAALSESLRRAEARVIQNFLNPGAAETMDPLTDWGEP